MYKCVCIQIYFNIYIYISYIYISYIYIIYIYILCVCQNGAAVFAKANIRNVSQKCSEAEVLLHFFIMSESDFYLSFLWFSCNSTPSNKHHQ